MELINATRMTAGYAMARDVSARGLLVVIVKGTFQMPAQSGGRLALAAEQAPLITSDEFHGEPGLSAPKYEIDYAPRKPFCDVLLNGTAYAPGGRPTDRMTVGLAIGNWSKSMAVVGNRVWLGAGGIRATAARPFVSMPISYDNAFGGADLRHESPAEHAAFMPNPSGRGFHRHLRAEWLEGSPLPNTEEPGVPITRPDGTYRPMAFGPLGRQWEPRVRFAGTYDQDWLDNVFPFLPADFDERYYQAAGPDQQVPRPVGEQMLRLSGLTPQGYLECVLPQFEAPIQVFPKRGAREDLVGTVDTIVVEPDLERVTLTWRVARPLRKDMFEIAQVLVGRKGTEWWQQRNRASFPLPLAVVPMDEEEEEEEEETEA